MPAGSAFTTLTQKRAVFPAFSSREVTLDQMRKIGIHFFINLVFPAFSSREVTLGQMRKISIHSIIYQPSAAKATDEH